MMIKDLVLICGFLLTYCAASVQITPVSTNTGTGNTAMETMTLGNYYYEFNTGLKAFTWAGMFPNAQPIKLFSRTGQLLTTALSSLSSIVYSVMMKDPLKIYILHRTGSDERVVQFTIQDLAGVYSTNSPGSTHIFTSSHQNLAQCRGESYFYLLNQLPTKIVSKVDPSTMLKVLSSASTPALISNGECLDCRTGSSLIVVSEDLGNTVTFDRTNMNVMKVITWSLAGRKIYGGVMESLDERVSYFFGALVSGGSKYICSVYLDEDHPSIPGVPRYLSSFITLNYYPEHVPLDFGVFQFVGLVSGSSSDLHLYAKYYLDLIQTLTLSFVPLSPTVNGVEWSSSNAAHFGFINLDANYNFHTYKLTFDNCYIRDANAICIECRPGYYRYPVTALADCQPNTTPGLGIVKLVYPPTLALCLVASCVSCYQDHSTCQQCDPGSSCVIAIPYIPPFSCADPLSIPEFMGCDLRTSLVRSCRSEGCLSCKADFNRCMKCSISMGFVLEDGSCVDVNTKKLGVGIDVSTGGSANCLVKDCLLCRNDHRYCTACNSQSGYELFMGECIVRSETQFVELVKAASGPGGSGIEFVFNGLVKTSGYLLTYFRLNLYDADRNLVTNDVKKFDLTPNRDGFNLEVLLPGNLLEATLEIDIRSDSVYILSSLIEPLDQDKRLYVAFPIVVKPVNLLNEPQTKGFLQSFNITLTSFSQSRVALAALLVSNPFVAIMLDKLFCDLAYLRLVGAQNLTYTKVMFQMIGSLRDNPILRLNPFEKLAIERGCSVSREFAENDVKCGLLANYGSDLIYLLITLAFCICISVVAFFTLKKINAKLKTLRESRLASASLLTLLFKLLRYVLKSLGVGFFFMKMDGNVLDILFFSLINIFAYQKSPPMIVGLAVSLLFILFYLGYCIVLFVFARRVRAAVEKTETDPNRKQKSSGLRKPLFNQLKGSAVGYHFVKQMFKGLYYCPQNLFNLNFPLVSIGRYASIALVLSGFNGKVWYIPFGCVIVETAFFAYALRAAVKASKLENWVEQFNSFIHVIYNVLGILSFAGESHRSRFAFDLLMLTTVGSKIVVNGLLFLTWIISAVYSIIADIIREFRGKRTQKLKTASVHPIAKPEPPSQSKVSSIMQKVLPEGKTPLRSSDKVSPSLKVIIASQPPTNNASLKLIQGRKVPMTHSIASVSKPGKPNQMKRKLGKP